MLTLELTAQELQELHITLFLRKNQLTEELQHKNTDIASIALRQIERLSPILYQVESMVREHHTREQVRKELEDRVEGFVEREMDRLDKKLMQGHITQKDYDDRVSIIDNWSKSELALA